ncbi:Fe-Mn family superoxide dismutase [Salinicola avicenniae]|uniref:Fe-Mn family superoxide dismutase n=1 Tax=Salinicola avicenniae TaxID=2916836 RepID=UPI0020741391|nr:MULTISPECIES: Fe-Mn family superoxide dismutase [unclassified Salinicola]
MSVSNFSFELPALPFERHSLEPAWSRAQVDLLYSHYHRRQLDRLNTLVSVGNRHSLAALTDAADPATRFAAAEAWNLTVFWHSLTPWSVLPSEWLEQRIVSDFGGVGALRERWRASIVTQASAQGWSWLARERDGTLDLRVGAAGVRLEQATPLLAVTLCPEARRIDFGEDAGRYFDALWPHLNWAFAQLGVEVDS